MGWMTEIFVSAYADGLFVGAENGSLFGAGLIEIIGIDVLLAGDNALVIALACRGLRPQQRLRALMLGAGVAVIMRVALTGLVMSLMTLPLLKLVAGLSLLVIAVKLLVPAQENEASVQAASHLWSAVRTIVVADMVMSLDNVMAVAAAANGSLTLVFLGLVISMPIVVAGSAVIMALLNRLPALIWCGAALLGWIAGGVIATDAAVGPWLHRLIGESVALGIGATSALFGIAKRTQEVGEVGQMVAAAFGVAVVSLGGLILRAQARRGEFAAAAQSADTFR